MFGVPVGCLHVPRQHLKAVIAELEGLHWLRSRGVVPSQDGPLVHAVHLTVAAACSLEAQQDIPAIVAALLDVGDIRWEAGARLHKMGTQRKDTRKQEAYGRRPCAFRFAELFAGIGGFRISLESLGGECVFASEIDGHAAATYSLNFEEVSAGDITEVETEAIPDHDLLV